jgi:hypothetical protein
MKRDFFKEVIVVGSYQIRGEWSSRRIREQLLIIHYRLFAIQHPASSIQHPVSSIQHPVSTIQYPPPFPNLWKLDFD